MEVIRIGLDIAKTVFQVHGVDSHGKPVLKKTLSRGEVLAFFANTIAPPGPGNRGRTTRPFAHTRRAYLGL